MTAPTQTPPPEAPRPVMTGLTWQQFLDLPGEHKHADLVNGELFVNPPALLHQQIVSRLLASLVNWTAAGPDRGEVTIEPAVQISDDRGYMPDIARIGVADLWFIDPDEPSAHIVSTHSDRLQTLDVAASERLRSPLLDGFGVTVGALVRR